MINNSNKDSSFIRFLCTAVKMTPGKPAYIRGLRVAVLLGLPILIGFYTNMLSQSFLLMFATLNVTLVDLGGMTYRKTARTMLITTILNAVAAIVAQWAGLHILTACIITAVWIAAVAMLGLLGNSGVMMAFVNSALFVIIVSNPNSNATTINTFLVFIAGGAWAMLLSLIAWPIKPYQPIRKAIASCFLENSIFLKQITNLYKDESAVLQQNTKQNIIDRAHQNFREKIDKAYEMLSIERQGRFNKSEVEDLLIALLHNISKDNRSIMTLMVWFQKKENSIKSKEIAQIFLALSNIHSDIAKLILNSTISEKEIIDKVNKLEEGLLNSETQRISSQFKEVHDSIEQILERVKNEVHLAERQKSSRKTKNDKIKHEALAVDNSVAFLTLLRNNLNIKSSAFRHAIRIGITAAIAVLIAHVINLPHGYWIPLTIVVIMAPDFGGSFLIRTLQRGTGTILGGLLAVLLITHVHSQLLIIILLIIFTFLAISMLTINYAVFVFFLTPLIVTMYSISDIGDWHIPLDRILDTFTGIIIALIFGQLLLPDWERNHFNDKLSAMLNATSSYFNSVLSNLTGEDESTNPLIALNRKMELATSNVNASFQRTLNQPGFNNKLITPTMSFIHSSNILMQSVVRLHEYSELHHINIENSKELQNVGQKILELLNLMSEKILLQKPKATLSHNSIIDIVNEMNNIASQIKSILATFSDTSLSAVEFKFLAQAEYNMLDTLSIYLSKQSGFDLPDKYLLNH